MESTLTLRQLVELWAERHAMDEAAIERAGTTPIEPFLNGISKIANVRDLQRQIATLHDSGIPAVFSFGAGSDLKDSNAVIISAFQSGLSLPNRDYYTNTDAKSAGVGWELCGWTSDARSLS